MKLVSLIICFLIGVNCIQQSLQQSHILVKDSPTDIGEDGVTDNGPLVDGPAYEEVVGVKHGVVGDSGASSGHSLIQISPVNITDRLIVRIFSKAFEYHRLYDNRGGFSVFNGQFYNDQLWRLEESETKKGKFFIVNVVTGARITSTGRSMFCSKGSYHDNQLWTFTAHGDGYIISNVYRPDYNIGSWQNFFGVRYVIGYSGEIDDHVVWTLRNPFASEAHWQPVRNFTNNGTLPLKQVVKFSEGFSESTSNTIATETTFEHSLSSSLSGAFGPLGVFTASQSSTSKFTAKISASLTRVSGTTRLEEDTTEVSIPAKSWWTMEQAESSTIDVTGKTFKYSSVYTRFDSGPLQ